MRLLGCWNPSVVLTYLGAAIAGGGIVFAVQGSLKGALTCLVVAGLIDLVDGPVARAVRRDERAKRFGVVLDSLADVVGFLALPAAVLATVLPGTAAAMVAAPYLMAGLARLAHFTTVDANAEGPVSHYHGLPVTYAALIVPVVCLLKPALPAVAFGVLLAAVMLAVAVAFVVPIRIPKPRGKAYACFGLLAVLLLVGIRVLPL